MKSGSLLDLIIESLPDMVFVKDAKELKFVHFNRAGENLIGVPRAQMLGKTDYDLFPTDEADGFTKKDREVLKKGEPVEIPEEVILTKKGKRLLRTVKVPIVKARGRYKYLLGISEDITEKRKADLKMNKLMLELERSNHELEEFAHVASHDLQEPLRMVAGFCHMLERQYKSQLDARGQMYIQCAVDGVQRMHKTIDALLSYAELGSTDAKAELVDLNAVLEDVLSDLSAMIKRKHATIYAPVLPTVYGQRVQLTQVFINLIGNALKFTRQKPVIKIACAKKGSHWEFEIKDNGIGIHKSHFEKIFLIFQRVYSDKEYQGKGIGLAVCKKVIAHHHGRIWLESVEGKGTSFFFTLPVVN